MPVGAFNKPRRCLMNEVFPIVSGLIIGLLVGLLRPSLRLGVAVLLSVAFGVVATVVSGEFRISWGYLLVDIPLVAGSAGLSFLLTRAARRSLS
jgi:hypothetical protein